MERSIENSNKIKLIWNLWLGVMLLALLFGGFAFGNGDLPATGGKYFLGGFGLSALLWMASYGYLYQKGYISPKM